MYLTISFSCQVRRASTAKSYRLPSDIVLINAE